MAVITLTSDLGLNDYYVGALKGAILSQLPEITIVDITHSVPPFDIRHTAYVLRQAYPHFPIGSIHVIGVNAEASANQKHLAIFCDGHYFIGTDNGIFSLIFEKKPDKIFDLDNIRPDATRMIFPIKDIFVKAACHLARNGTLEILGNQQSEFLKLATLNPAYSDNILHGTVIYIDSYGNAVTNITKKLFIDTIKGRNFSIEIQGEEITEISNVYSGAASGNLLALFNAAEYLEVAQSQGNISKLYGIETGNSVAVRVNI